MTPGHHDSHTSPWGARGQTATLTSRPGLSALSLALGTENIKSLENAFSEALTMPKAQCRAFHPQPHFILSNAGRWRSLTGGKPETAGITHWLKPLGRSKIQTKVYVIPNSALSPRHLVS